MYEQEKSYSSIDLLKFLIRNYKALFLATMLGAIASIIISLTITPKYKSAVVIFPASSSSVSKALLTDMSRAPKDILKFGEEEETEQLLQILQSDEIKANIIQKYDLLNHYQINLDSKYKKTELLNEYMDNISVRKTEYQAIEIKALDTDPETAAAIVNDIAGLLDSVYNKIQKDRAFKALEIVERVYKNQKDFVNKLEDSLTTVKNTALYNSLIKQHEEEIKQLSLLKSKFNEAQVDAYHDLPHKYIVNPAQVSEKKAYPVRWLIVVLSTLGTFIFAFFMLAIIEKIKILRTELKTGEITEKKLG